MTNWTQFADIYCLLQVLILLEISIFLTSTLPLSMSTQVSTYVVLVACAVLATKPVLRCQLSSQTTGAFPLQSLSGYAPMWLLIEPALLMLLVSLSSWRNLAWRLGMWAAAAPSWVTCTSGQMKTTMLERWSGKYMLGELLPPCWNCASALWLRHWGSVDRDEIAQCWWLMQLQLFDVELLSKLNCYLCCRVDLSLTIYLSNHAQI